jgi:hypothetical protein
LHLFCIFFVFFPYFFYTLRFKLQKKATGKTHWFPLLFFAPAYSATSRVAFLGIRRVNPSLEAIRFPSFVLCQAQVGEFVIDDSRWKTRAKRERSSVLHIYILMRKQRATASARLGFRTCTATTTTTTATIGSKRHLAKNIGVPPPNQLQRTQLYVVPYLRRNMGNLPKVRS